MKNAIINRPWAIIIVGYLIAMVAWVFMAAAAIKDQDQLVFPVPTIQK